jgi:hypothetical protein
MSPSLRALAVLWVAALCVAADCGGGSGSAGDPSVIETLDLDPRCQTLGPSAFPPGFDLVPGSDAQIVALNFSPSLVVPIDGAGAAPALATQPAILAIPDDSDADGVAEGSFNILAFPLLDGVNVHDPLLAAQELGLLTASNYEEVIFFRPRAGLLQALLAELSPDARPEDFPRIPVYGAAALRTAISTRICVKPTRTIDSFGDDYTLGLPDSVFCDPAQRGSFFARFTSGAAVAANRLFVSMSNVGRGAGGSETQYLPGAVLVFDLDFGASPPRITPDPQTPFIITEAFNPTHVTRYASGDREFVLVSSSGAIGIEPDDPSTPEIEAGTRVLSDAAIEVIDAQTLALVATIPLGPAALAGDRLAIDPTGRIAAVGSEAGRLLFVIDLAPLATLPDTVTSPIVLRDAVIFDAFVPLEIPHRAGGPDSRTCPGFSSGVAFNQAGDRLFASERCDGSFTIYAYTLPVARDQPVDPSRFFVADSRPLLAPLTSQTLGELRDPGAILVRPGVPGVDFSGPDAFVLASQPDASICGIHTESF